MASLKYFCEDAPGYHIIAAGSLLGVAVNRSNFSFPVGKVDMKTLYPMDMEEFMLAMGEENLVTQIKKCFETDTPMPSALHDAAMQLYRQYLIVGGMPECVIQFAETNDYILVRHTQDTILAGYLNDMSKYNNLNEIKKPDLLMTENYVNIQLTINGYKTYYWESARGAEIDFVIHRNGQLIPVEVKSADNTRAKSLKVYMDTCKPAYAIKLSAKNFAFEDNKKIVPLYAAFCI